MKPPAQWDAICVGAGITSLAFCAHLIARRPATRILVIDKHSVAGGYASVFERPKAPGVFDCSLHKLSGMGEGGNLRRMFESLGLDRELTLVTPSTYFEACLPEGSFVLGNSHPAAERALVERFPAERQAIVDFFREVNTYGRHGYYQFQMMEGTYEADFAELRHAHRHLKHVSVSDALAARFQDGLLREIIGATAVYVGGFPEDLSYLYFLHVVYATLCKSNAYVQGASQALSNSLARRVTDAGGAVMLDTAVQRIVEDADGNAVGVDTAQGRFLSNRVYVNASPHYAMRNLFAASAKMGAVDAKLRALKPSRSTTTVYLTCDQRPSELGLASCETMIFAGTHQSSLAERARAHAAPEDQALCEHAFWHSSPMEVTNYNLLDPAGGNVVCLNVLDSIGHWPERRAATYKAKKQRAIDAMLGRLFAAKPQLEGHVAYCELSSPRTYQRFTNNTDGAGYGAMVGLDMSGHAFHRQFPVKGVHFLSAWVAGPSYEAAFGYAEMKAKQWTASAAPAARAPSRHEEAKETA
ncbi:MAG TPA: NAD(P)-binding protein [Burkholderiaceae bacterium]|nr:NAD(P)-binding protein [Burkholderiaceae bacterium]